MNCLRKKCSCPKYRDFKTEEELKKWIKINKTKEGGLDI